MRLTVDVTLSLPPERLHPLVWAYVGDAVYELYVRTHLLARGVLKPGDLQRAAVAYVSARGQARVVHRLLPLLSEEEAAVLRRGRNAKSGTIPKNARVSEYRLSTGLESLFGYLYLTGQEGRLRELIAHALTAMDGDGGPPEPEGSETR